MKDDKHMKRKKTPSWARKCVCLGSTTFVPIHDCAHTRLCPDMIVSTRLSPYMTVPRHVCTQTCLCPETFVPRGICDQRHLCPDMIVWAHTCLCLCPDTLVPQHELWTDTVMSLDNNYIITSVEAR